MYRDAAMDFSTPHSHRTRTRLCGSWASTTNRDHRLPTG